MDFTKMSNDEVQEWSADAQFWGDKCNSDSAQGNLHGRTPIEHAKVALDWQDVLNGSNAELSRRQQSA